MKNLVKFESTFRKMYNLKENYVKIKFINPNDLDLTFKTRFYLFFSNCKYKLPVEYNSVLF